MKSLKQVWAAAQRTKPMGKFPSASFLRTICFQKRQSRMKMNKALLVFLAVAGVSVSGPMVKW